MGAEVESWRVDAREGPCAFCRQNVERHRCTACPRCDTVYHPECWVSNSRRCAVYGCEPGQKAGALTGPAVRPVLEPPPLPATGASLAFLSPMAAVLLVILARIGMDESPHRTSPPPRPPELREDFAPARTAEVSVLMEEARVLEDAVTPLTSMPDNPVSGVWRTRAIETVKDDLDKLGRALDLTRRCAAAEPRGVHQSHLVNLRWKIDQKRRLLLDLMRR